MWQASSAEEFIGGYSNIKRSYRLHLCVLCLPYHVSFIIMDLFVPIFVKHVQVLSETWGVQHWCEMTSKPVWGVLRGNDDMTWFGQNECRCWLGSLNVAATATHEICEVCHWIGLRPFLYDPHLYGVHSTPTWVVILWCINEVSQVRLVLGWFSIIGSSAPVPCPQSITALLFCSFFHKGSPYHPYISWHPWSEGLAFDESQLGVSFEKEPLRVMHYGCNRFQPGQWHASGLIPRHGVYGAWSEGPEQSLNFQVSFVEKYAIFPITDEPIREAVFFSGGGGKGFRILYIYIRIYTYVDRKNQVDNVLGVYGPSSCMKDWDPVCVGAWKVFTIHVLVLQLAWLTYQLNEMVEMIIS